MITEERLNASAAVPPSSRERIVATARDLFIERGYPGVSMQQIADASGLRKASLYHHFKSKEALFAEVMAVEMDQLLDDFREADRAAGTIGNRLEAIALINYRRFAQPDVFQMAQDFFKYVPDSDHEEVHKRLREMERFFADVFAQAIATGEIQDVDPDVAATMYFHMMMALAKDPHHYRTTAPPPPEEAARLVARVMLYGLSEPPR